MFFLLFTYYTSFFVDGRCFMWCLVAWGLFGGIQKYFFAHLLFSFVLRLHILLICCHFFLAVCFCVQVALGKSGGGGRWGLVPFDGIGLVG
ncbi:hypothetical protein BJ508DRAFT_28452 [Ascobolus immersus RN42]|uniref:Uncharacterized protein n=1 Tax=Ascobolus immersus RN42 TaxID=1160509 RepID=A0A3N4HM91_ASCIM|nr:hypothetical protein BJ508DRAFT_28452 [Ascobolus immersus RN42]